MEFIRAQCQIVVEVGSAMTEHGQHGPHVSKQLFEVFLILREQRRQLYCVYLHQVVEEEEFIHEKLLWLGFHSLGDLFKRLLAH